ncbi:hypothetical protein [Scytonema sp. UIC 10036]|uniref:hypothetical protein n=1 Tax=Scytonema sp. UIC 10036 TaxID=2304196 RepID=UPI001A9A9C61|nr:hypothetical protein [Scytonema sp. UIC 10036]
MKLKLGKKRLEVLLINQKLLLIKYISEIEIDLWKGQVIRVDAFSFAIRWVGLAPKRYGLSR